MDKFFTFTHIYMKHETLVLATDNYIDKIYNIPPSLNKEHRGVGREFN